MVLISSAAVVISLFAIAVCLFANGGATPCIQTQKMDFGPAYKLEDLDSVDGMVMAKTDAVDLYKNIGTQNSIDLKGLDESLLKGQVRGIEGLDETQVPEPATVTLLALGGLAMLRKRRGSRKNA